MVPLPSVQEWQIEAEGLLLSVSICAHACAELLVAFANVDASMSPCLLTVLLWSPMLDWLCGRSILHSSSLPSVLWSCIT